jgi:hypothetical protein
MNRRQQKKLEKRNGHFHYKDYKFYRRVFEIAEAKYGKESVQAWLLIPKKHSYSNKLLYVKTTRKGWPIDVDMFHDVYPSAPRTTFTERNIPEINLTYTELASMEPDPGVVSEFERRYNEWLNFVKGKNVK